MSDSDNIMEMLKSIQSWIWTLSESVKTLNERVDDIEKKAERNAAIANGDEDKVWESIPKANVPKAVKVIQYRTNPDWTQEYKLPWRTFRSAQEAESYVKELEKQWKTFTKFFI